MALAFLSSDVILIASVQFKLIVGNFQFYSYHRKKKISNVNVFYLFIIRVRNEIYRRKKAKENKYCHLLVFYSIIVYLINLIFIHFAFSIKSNIFFICFIFLLLFKVKIHLSNDSI